MKCLKEVKIAYAPWADRQREALWMYFLPTLYEDSPVTPEPTVGQTRIFKTVHFKLWLHCPTIADVYFMKKMVRSFTVCFARRTNALFVALFQKLHQIHAELPKQNSYFEATFPFITNPDGFDTHLTMNIIQPTVRTNLSFSPLVQADRVDVRSHVFSRSSLTAILSFLQMELHIHYPRLWNSIQDWFVDINARKAQVYFVLEHKNFFQSKHSPSSYAPIHSTLSYSLAQRLVVVDAAGHLFVHAVHLQFRSARRSRRSTPAVQSRQLDRLHQEHDSTCREQ